MQLLLILAIVVLFQVIITLIAYDRLRRVLELQLSKARRIQSRRLDRVGKEIDELLDNSITAKMIAVEARETAEAANRTSEAISARFDRGEQPKPLIAGASIESYRKRGEDRFVEKMNNFKAVVRGQENP